MLVVSSIIIYLVGWLGSRWRKNRKIAIRSKRLRIMMIRNLGSLASRLVISVLTNFKLPMGMNF